MTNREYMESLSDEELAKILIYKHFWLCGFKQINSSLYGPVDYQMMNDLKEWLSLEHEEE